MTSHGLDSRAWRHLRIEVLNRDGWRCQIHGPGCKGTATEVDHITARADGGALLDPANCRAACKPCNSARGAGHTNAMRYRTTVPTYDTRM